MQDFMTIDPAREDLLVLVDGRDRQVGVASKEEAHRSGLLHRAFSVVLTREADCDNELLLAQRAEGKYHSAGLWANSCCSHPRDGEGILEAAYRRVQEELGCRAVGLKEIGSFAYRAEFENGLCEYEYDHVLMGTCDATPVPDPNEVGGLRWVSANGLAEELREHPKTFAPWAFTVLTMALQRLQDEG